VNNRDLRHFEIDFETTARLRPLVPSECLLVSESGINTPDDVRRLAEMGADAMLVGERFMRSKDVAERVRELVAAGKAP
jgi:indole-3-glycerol phosphate synthase